MGDCSKAYKEVDEILKYIPKNEYKKIPKNFIQFIKINMDKEYSYKVQNIKNFKEEKMLKETRIILSILYRDYWATPDKRKEIIKRDKEQIKKAEEEKEQKYNIENILKNRNTNNKLENKCENMEQNKEIIKYKESILKSFFNKIAKIFRK